MKQRFWPIFSRIIEHDKRQGKSYKGIQGILTNFIQAISSFLEDVRSRETMFPMKGFFPGDKCFWPIFSRIIEHDKSQGTTYQGTKSTLTSIAQAI